jgi:hypothetical protein
MQVKRIDERNTKVIFSIIPFKGVGVYKCTIIVIHGTIMGRRPGLF